MPVLLVCSCGDCRHWEIEQDHIVCMSCGKRFNTPELGAALDDHVEAHAELSWKEHAR
jgi:Fe2+ or Zn2+ uptake regulation protein